MPSIGESAIRGFTGGLTSGLQLGMQLDEQKAKVDARLAGIGKEKEAKAQQELENSRKNAEFGLKFSENKLLSKKDRIDGLNAYRIFRNKYIDPENPIPEFTDLPEFTSDLSKRIGAVNKEVTEGRVGFEQGAQMVRNLELEFGADYNKFLETTASGITDIGEREQAVQAAALGRLAPVEAGISQEEITTARDVALSRGGELGTSILEKELESRIKGDKEFARQVETANLPVPGEPDKFQKVVIDRTTGKSTPVVDTEGNPVFLNEKQVLLSEGKKAQSLINPFETKFLGRLGESEATRITELRIKAVDAVSSKKIIQEGRDLIAQGIYTGSAANIKKSLDKWLQEANIFVGGRKAANTEAYASMMGLQVGKIIKQFGAGTGLSDADREYAENIVGGRVTLTEDAIVRLLDINERLADFTIEEFNSQAGRARTALETKDYLQPVEIPQAATPTAQPRVKRFNPATGRIE